MFVSKEPVPVSVPDDPDNLIYIKAKMDYGTKQRVSNAILHVPTKDAAHVGDTPMDMAAYQIALLVHNIVRWEGPAFAGVPCTAANIEALDPDEPLVTAVLDEITRRNRRADDADPNASAPSGSDGWTDLKTKAPTPVPGTSMSLVPNATTGRRSK